MKKLLLLALLSLSTLIGYSQMNYHQTISLSSLQDTICGGEFSLISVSPEADSSTTSSYNGNFWFNPPFGVPVTYIIHAEGMCGCVFDTTFTETLDSTQQYGFHIFQIEGSGFYGVSWTDCSGGINEIKANKLTTYPNPVEDALTVTTPLNSGFVKVYSADGKYVIFSNFYSSTFTLDTGLLDKGSYLIRVYDIDGNTHIGRFVK